MAKIILTETELDVLQKVLRDNPPAKVNLDGAERYFYRHVLTKILKEDFSFPKTDEGMEV